MDCSEFLADFSDFRDDLLGSAERDRMERHLTSCSGCRRYLRVLEDGLGALRSRSPLPVPEDFRPRLRHRIFHVEDERALARRSSRSGVIASVALAMAVLLALAAWSPLLRTPDDDVTIATIVVSEPGSGGAGLSVPPSAFFDDPRPLFVGGAEERRLWDRPSTLLLRYSPLLARTGPAAAGRDRRE